MTINTAVLVLLIVIFIEVTVLVLRGRANRPVRRITTGRGIFIDTSVLIDGRIIPVATSGFVSDVLYIPRSVIGELQLLADSADGDKRAKARYGLDVVTELQQLPGVQVEIFPDGSRADEGVDERLLLLAKQQSGVICTVDYNLNKVAQVEGISVLNINELAKELRVTYLPGERLKLALTSKGNDSSQAVGHLDDGTMVVVEKAKAKIGSTVEIEVIRSLQTSAGKMMFARLTGASAGQEASPQKPKQSPKGRAAAVMSTPVVAPATSAAPVNESAKPGRQQPQASRKEPSTQTKSRQQSPARQQSQKPPRTSTGNSSRRRRSSQDNESRLIELVNKQQ